MEVKVDLPITDDSQSNDRPNNHLAPPADQLLALANQCLLDALVDPKTEEDLEDLLKITKPQIKQWCKDLVSQGLIRKMNRPVRYVRC